ncbi:MAG: hypothetical protein ACOCTI_04490, partial [Phycisphaeraceae bacterium]
ADSAPRRLIVVSSDHAVRRAARRRRATSWTSEQFLHELSIRLSTPPPEPAPPVKRRPGDMPPEEVDRWLERFGFNPGELKDEPGEDDEPWPPW